MTMTETYKYTNIELTPTVFKELLILLFDGKQFDRQTAMSTILNYHIQHGGTFRDGKNITAVFKKATQFLGDRGICNLGYGTWKLNFEIPTTEVVERQEEESTFVSDRTIGNGNSFVYVYFYDSYRQLAELRGQNVWPCKIGRTETEPLQRVMGQCGTCFPEIPHVALVIKCSDSSKLELALHSILKFKDRHMNNAPGTEWFLTSPEEIEEIVLKIQ